MNEIVNLLREIGANDSNTKTIKISVYLMSGQDEISSRDVLPDIIKEHQEIAALIVRLMELVGYTEDEYDDDEGITERHPLGDYVEAAKPHLFEIWIYAELQIKATQEQMDWFDKNVPKHGPTYSRYFERLLERTARLWEYFGGRVNHGKKYNRFFTAVVKPPLSDKKVQQKHNIIWSNSTFKNHVEKHMKENDIAGTRGSKRKILR